jgi:hypothetical protein
VTAKRALVLAAVIVIGLTAFLSVAVIRVAPRLRQQVVRALEARMNAAVTLDALHVRMWPRPTVLGGGLTIRQRDRPDLPPLIVVRAFSGDASWRGIFEARLRAIVLDGLEVTIPPKRRADMPTLTADQAPADDAEPREDRSRFGIATLTATNARLTILPRNPEKDPRVFDIHSLKMDDLTLLTASRFEASIMNPVPVGRVETRGTFGPWSQGEAGDTPLDGQFQFDADLGTIKGIAGALHSTGGFGGVLDRIAVTGRTETPDFSIPKLKAAALPLSTTFAAVVDGTNGDVQLENVDIRLADSHLISHGFVVGTKGIKGKRVLLDVTGDDARIEDILRLTVRTSPPVMHGGLALTASFDLPQGDKDVVERLRLGGGVTIRDARFANDAVQGKVDALSRRAVGRPGDESVRNVPSTVRARFTMADGTLNLKDVNYQVTGASIALHGRYVLTEGALDLDGVVRLRATASATQTGMRHFLLKPFDGLFKKGGSGTRLVISINGTVDAPKVGLDVARTLKGK